MTAGIRIQERPRASAGPARILLYSRAALFAFVVALAVSIIGSTGADTVSGRLGGDFPAFYAAGSIVADGDWADLYDPDRQIEAQAELFGDAEGSYLYFAYPPHAAPMYRPLAAVDYRVAYAIHTLVMAAALVVALALVRPMLRVAREHFELIATGALLCYPMLRAVTGGQNTALSLLAIAATWRLLDDERDVAAGLVLALLLYKPQLAVPLIGLALIARRWRAVAGAAAGAAVVWAFGAAVMGADWVGRWWGDVADFAAADADINGHNAISWIGVGDALFGAGSATAALIGWPLVAATVLGLVWLWSRPDVELATRVAVATTGVILISPHAMFYDAGLLVLPALVAIDRLPRLDPRTLRTIIFLWAAAWLHLLADPIGLAPLFLVTLATAAWTTHTLLRHPAPPAPHQTGSPPPSTRSAPTPAR